MIKSQNNENENEGESLLDSLYKMTKESTQNECNIKLLQKVVELNNKIFYHQVEEHCLNERINGLISQIQFRDQNQRIITLQLNIQQSDTNTYKQKVTMLEQIIESMRQHKKLIIKEFQQSQKKLRASIAEKQRDYTTTIQIKEVQTKQREGQIKATLEGISKELKEEKQKNLTLIRNNDQSLKSFQVYYNLYEELKNMLILTLSQNKDLKNPDFAFLSQLVSNICFKVQELEFEKKKIQQFVTIQEGNNSYREQNLFNRVKTNFKKYEEKALRKQKNLENVEIFINNLLKQEGFQNDFSYGQALLQKLKDKFIDYKAKLQQLKKNIQVCTQKQKIKEQEIKKIKETALKYKQQYQRIKKQQMKVLQELEKQKKVGENYKRSYQQLNSQLEVNINSSKLKMSKITQNFQSQSSKKEQIILNLNKKIRDIEQKKQNELSNERKKIEKLEEKLKQFQNEINAEIERFDQAQKKHQKQIEQIQKSNKNGEQRINKIKEDCELQKRKIKSQLDEFKKKYLDLEDNNKNITKMIDEVKNNLEIKSLQIKQIQQQLCAIVNQARLDRNQSTKNAQTYKQALYALNKLLKDSGAKTGSALFRIPSLSEKYQGNIQWVKGIIDQYCGCGTKFESKFIGKIDEYFRDFSKILNNQNLIPNLLLIIQTSKGVSFCIFITKFTTNIKDKDPVVFFSAEKKLKYPNELKKITDARPSMINAQGAIQFGKKQLTISKMLEMKLNIVPTGYFGNLDIQSMYGIQTVAEPLTIQKMQIHQIVF